MSEVLINADAEWMADAHCRNTKMDPALFFPERGDTRPTAEQLCRPCTVKAECLNYSLENNLWQGIWGGQSGRQRREIKRKRRMR